MQSKTPKSEATPDPTETWTKFLATFPAAAPGSLPWMNLEAAEQAADMGADFVQFVSDRIREDVKTQHALLHCKDPGEFAKIQETFLQTAVNQYAAQTGRMVEMSAGLLATVMRGAERKKPD